jgi:hypothetical protein
MRLSQRVVDSACVDVDADVDVDDAAMLRDRLALQSS